MNRCASQRRGPDRGSATRSPLGSWKERPELCARLAPLNQPTAPSPRPSPPPRGRRCPKGGGGGGRGEGTAAARRVFWAPWIGTLRRGRSPNPAEDSPSVQGVAALMAV